MNNLYLCPALKTQINYENSKTLLVRCHCIDYNDKVFLHVKAMRKEDLTFQDYTVRLGGAIWDLKTDMENLFTVTSHSPQVLSQIMV